jgi:hypothetical protein
MLFGKGVKADRALHGVFRLQDVFLIYFFPQQLPPAWPFPHPVPQPWLLAPQLDASLHFPAPAQFAISLHFPVDPQLSHLPSPFLSTKFFPWAHAPFAV